MAPFEGLLALADLEIESIVARDGELVLQARTRQVSARCPGCGTLSQRVHSYYTRHPTDLPIGDRPTRLCLRARRFRCLNPQCPRSTFAEALPGFLKRYSRRSMRLVAALEAVAFALGGQAGSCLAHHLKMPCSGATLLRLIRRAVTPACAPPRVIGIDDWAKQRGQVYGTILVDLERRRTIDLLSDRRAETLIAWLRQHPGVQVVTRDRSPEYRRAVETVWPHCEQVADRWHLFKNLGDALERLVIRHRPSLKPPPPLASSSPVLPSVALEIPVLRLPDHIRYGAEVRHERYIQREQLYGQMQALHAAGLKPGAIGRQLGVARNTVRSYLARGGPPPELHRLPPRPKRIDPYLPHLAQRWQVGCRTASQLWREICALGFQGPRPLVARWVRERREQPAPTTPPRFRSGFQSGMDTPTSPASGASGLALPDSRTLAWLLMRSPQALTPDQQVHLERLRTVEHLCVSHELAQRFLQLVRTHAVADLEPWLQQAAHTRIREWRALVGGLCQDLAAVRAALTSAWSNSQTEGQVNNLKLLKRQMYGRAKLDLLRARMLRPP
jgi:transposase